MRIGQCCRLGLLVSAIGLACLADAPGTRAALAQSKEKSKESRVTKENADRVKTGMSAKEVEAILGPGKAMPASEYPEPRTRIQARIKQMLDSGAAKARKWEDGRKQIIVVFRGGKVTAISTRNL